MSANKMSSGPSLGQLSVVMVVAVVAIGIVASGQFLQPQSHLGRIMQTFTSPIVIHQGAGDGELGAERTSGPEGQLGASASRYYASSGSHHPEAGAGPTDEEGGVAHDGLRLQQAPSQQRGRPAHQQYYGPAAAAGGNDGANRYESNSDELDEARAPSRHLQQQAGSNGGGGGDSFQMGAYLGPSMDDREINGAFGSSANGGDERDDERDSYDGGPAPGAAHSAASRGQPIAYDGPAGYQDGAKHSAANNNNNYGPSNSYDDDSSADEDEPRDDVRRPATRANRAPLRQAASQHRDRSLRARQGLMAAAANGNGYGAYGPANGYASGPVDLTGMLSGGFGDPSGGYYGGGPGGYGPPPPGYPGAGNGRQSNRDNDNDDDNDDDRRA